jgi:hypothetical protein
VPANSQLLRTPAEWVEQEASTSMRYGNRTEAAEFGDPDAMLARYEPGPDRVARVVLHPRLSFVPCATADFEAFRTSFAVDIEARIFTGDDVAGARAEGTGNADRIAGLDEAIEAVLSARDQQDVAHRRGSEIAVRLEEARAGLGRVAEQRTEVEAAVAAARARLSVLEGAGVPEHVLEREAEEARAELQAAEAALLLTSETASDGGPEVRKANAELERSERELRRIEAQAVGGDYALDAASHQLELWAAQRAFETARFEVERLQRLTVDHDAEQVIAAARERADTARTRLAGAERALADRRAAGLPDDPAGEADALRSQIAAVERSLADADAARTAEVTSLEQEDESARRDAEAAARQLEYALDRIDTGVDAEDLDGVLAELRRRRDELTAGDEGLSVIGRVLRDLALDAPEPLFVLIEPSAEPGEDLIGALISVSGLKRTVVVTDKTEVLHEARELDPALGAVREPLETGGGQRQELAQSDGNRT